MSSLIRFTLIALALLSTAACSSKPVLNPHRSVPLEIHASQEQMKQAILTTLIKRKWTVQRVGPTKIQAEITVREQFHAEIDIDYSPVSYKINYRDSRGLNYSDGKIHKNYIRWVRLLDKGILQELRNTQAQTSARNISNTPPTVTP